LACRKDDVGNDRERECVRRAATGDRAAFAELVERYWPPVRAWLAGLCGDAHAADDLAQEAFLKAWGALPGLAEPGAFRVWLFRIARNEWLASARGRKPDSGAPPGAAPEVQDARPGPAQSAEEREAEVALRGALAELPPVYREAYLLWANEGLTYSEMARVLDTTEPTARQRVCEARRRLVRALAPHLNPPNP
jgi:RNA polymerase sigma-70 factor (ECF subfamily)